MVAHMNVYCKKRKPSKYLQNYAHNTPPKGKNCVYHGSFQSCSGNSPISFHIWNI